MYSVEHSLTFPDIGFVSHHRDLMALLDFEQAGIVS